MTMHPDSPGARSLPQPRMFFWVPLDGKRHAADIQDKHRPTGTPIATFCGQELPRVRETDVEWLWPTCLECWSIVEADVEPQP